MRHSLDKKKLLSLTFITSVLYFCGYISSDYYNRILGIKINYDALEIIKWGADFFIYSVIGFFSIVLNMIKLGKDWLRYEFIIVIFLDVIILIFSRYLATKKSESTGFFKILQTRCKYTYWSYVFFAVISFLSIHYLTLFIGKTDLDYREFFKFRNLYAIYSFFIILNILNIINIFNSSWKSVGEKYIKYFLITPLLFLPALYGVYGRNYNFNYIRQSSFEISLLLESHNGKYYFLKRDYFCKNIEEVAKGECNHASYQYMILNNEEYSLTVDRINFFDFIKDKYHENYD